MECKGTPQNSNYMQYRVEKNEHSFEVVITIIKGMLVLLDVQPAAYTEIKEKYRDTTFSFTFRAKIMWSLWAF